MLLYYNDYILDNTIGVCHNKKTKQTIVKKWSTDSSDKNTETKDE